MIDYDFLRRVQTEQPGGLRTAAQFIAARHAPGEPVIVCSPYFYLPVRYELGDCADCRLLDSGRPLLHFEGTAVLTPRDFISPSEATACGGNRIWVVEGDGRAATCALPARRWRRTGQQSFFEEYGIRGELTVVEYARLDN